MSRFCGGPRDGQTASHVSPKAPEVCVKPPGSKTWYRYIRSKVTQDLLYDGECPGHDYFDHDEPYCPDVKEVA